MAWINVVLDWALQFAYYGGFVGGLSLLLVGVTYPVWIKRFFPIVFIVMKNAGGAYDNQTVGLDRKIIRRGRIINTSYGERVKILGRKNTFSTALVSRENAITVEGRGVAFIIYEKELNQFFPVKNQAKGVNPEDDNVLELKDPRGEWLTLSKEKRELGAVLEKTYKHLLSIHPRMKEYIAYGPARAQAIPVTFANHAVKLRPFPIDAVTSTWFDMMIRRDRIHKQTFWEKYGAYIGLAAIAAIMLVAMIMTYEQMNKLADRVQGGVAMTEDSLAQKIADKMGGAEPAPGGKTAAFIPAVPFLLWRRRLSG